MSDNRTKIEKKIDNDIELFRKTSNSSMLEAAKLVKTALIDNSHSDKKVSEVEVLQSLVKEHEKAIGLYLKADRHDLIAIETAELDYVKNLLPKEPSEQEIKDSISVWVKEHKDTTSIDMKCTKLVISAVSDKYPTAQRGTIVKIFKSLING